MPSGLSWPRYIAFCASAFFTMMAGAQFVHVIYKPLDDLDDLVEEKLKETQEELGRKKS